MNQDYQINYAQKVITIIQKKMEDYQSDSIQLLAKVQIKDEIIAELKSKEESFNKTQDGSLQQLIVKDKEIEKLNFAIQARETESINKITTTKTYYNEKLKIAAATLDKQKREFNKIESGLRLKYETTEAIEIALLKNELNELKNKPKKLKKKILNG